MEAGDATSVSISPAAGSRPTALYLIPECFYLKSSLVITVSMDYIILQGNSTHPNPLTRVAGAISQTPQGFSLYRSRILLDTGAPASLDWNGIQSITSSVVMFLVDTTDLGAGTTLPSFPKHIPSFRMIACGLSGQLPAQLFQAPRVPPYSSFSVDLSNNDLEGTISPSFLGGFNFAPATSINFALSGNRLSGEIPSALFDVELNAIQMVTVVLDSNAFSGPLTNLFASTTFNHATLTQFTVSASSNNFDGAIPAWLNATRKLASYNLYCDYCKLTSVANSPFDAAASDVKSTLTISVQNNQISGPIPSSFFMLTNSPRTIDLVITGNNLGDLPVDLFDRANFTLTQSVYLEFSNSNLTGGLPNSAGLFADVDNMYYAYFDDNANLTGTIPPTFLSSLRAHATPSTPTSIYLSIENSPLTGELVFPDFGNASAVDFDVLASNTRFNAVSFPNGTSGLARLYLKDNPNLTGPLSSALFEFNPALTLLDASSTSLNGAMPNMGALNPGSLKTLDLSDTGIDFCSGDRDNWVSSKLTSCALYHTTAFYCKAEYPGSCRVSVPPPTAVPGSPSSPDTTPSSSNPLAPSVGSNPNVGPSAVPNSGVPRSSAEPTPSTAAARPAISVTICLLIMVAISLM